ncbi:hypothetical protein WA5_1663 [Corynebacterium glutamicum K051]|uniref:Uncharacterized protein n=1 Tax=Corynebacterium glutamicum (strain ATCC 13032 / DSM 20300 / JCM 1318 / BCRC 11384 / CCUG 27702 / LMG 3730 / NBRC 12168 / NCIMB 10025 / NRRL B-2784 / 534) TaxID=196627 RepID=Q8NPS8_CORGL|nr:Hypothetical protein [Corynebacterium glutamicum ATCC 13032]CCH24883.1 hypothetical protein WA5_1663 [Corynebacterium glutamicum K051]
MRRVNAAVVGVKNRTFEVSTLVFSHEQRVLDQARAHVICDRKAHQPAGVTVNDRGQVHIRPILNWQIGDIPDIELVRLVSGELPADKVREHCLGFVRHGGGDLAFLCVSEQLQRSHDPGNPLVVRKVMADLVFEFSRDSFGPITATVSGEYSLDLDPKNSVAEQAFFTREGGAFPFVI